MAKKTLNAGVWLCVNPGAAYAPGVEITINIGKTTANIRYEFKNSDSVAPNYTDDISEPIQSLSVKAVDGKGFLWLISQSVDVDVQVETITPAFTSSTFPSGIASETKQNDQITELQAIKTAVQTVAAESDATTITGYIDSVGVRFLTRFDPTATQKTKHYRLDDGTAYSPVAPFELISSNVEVFNYVATAAGTEYSKNDILVKFTDTETKSSAWRNETTNLAISSPISGTYGEIGKVGAATLAEQQTQTSAQQRIRDAIEKTVATGAGKTPVIGDFSPAVPPDIFQPISSAVFEPIAGRDFNIQVIFGAGVTGNVQLEQSLDGTNFYPLTGSSVAIMRFSSNSVEQWSNSEVGAKFRLSCTEISGGTINYRISQ